MLTSCSLLVDHFTGWTLDCYWFFDTTQITTFRGFLSACIFADLFTFYQRFRSTKYVYVRRYVTNYYVPYAIKFGEIPVNTSFCVTDEVLALNLHMWHNTFVLHVQNKACMGFPATLFCKLQRSHVIVLSDRGLPVRYTHLTVTTGGCTYSVQYMYN